MIIEKNRSSEVPIEELKLLANWLAEPGIKFFQELLETHNTLSPVLFFGKIPHPVHFREGMQIRNFLRGLPFFANWDAHELDDSWEGIVSRVLKMKKEEDSSELS